MLRTRLFINTTPCILHLYAKIQVKHESKTFISRMLAPIKESSNKNEFMTALNEYCKTHNIPDRTVDCFINDYEIYVDNKTRSLPSSMRS